MSQATLQFLGTIATALLALFGIYLSTRQTSKKSSTDAAQKLFEEVQEERALLKAERDALVQKIKDLEDGQRNDRTRYDEELRALKHRELARDDFIQELRNHIRQEKGPPPPDWPEELRHA